MQCVWSLPEEVGDASLGDLHNILGCASWLQSPRGVSQPPCYRAVFQQLSLEQKWGVPLTHNDHASTAVVDPAFAIPLHFLLSVQDN